MVERSEVLCSDPSYLPSAVEVDETAVFALLPPGDVAMKRQTADVDDASQLPRSDAPPMATATTDGALVDFAMAEVLCELAAPIEPPIEGFSEAEDEMQAEGDAMEAEEDEKIAAAAMALIGVGPSEEPFTRAMCSVVSPSEDNDDESEIASGAARWLDASRMPAMEREERLCEKEEQGTLRFELVGNLCPDGVCKSALLLLVGLFSRLLPEMDIAYITKNVFDARHLAIAVIEGGVVVAGCLYRPHPREALPAPALSRKKTPAKKVTMPPPPAFTEPFAELIFFAVESDRQVGGLGSRLMNRLKTELLRQQLPRILTYADNTAISFFQNQGFTHKLTLPKAHYDSRIGAYNDSVLHEAVLYHDIPYSQLPKLIRSERAKIMSSWEDAKLQPPPPSPPTTVVASGRRRRRRDESLSPGDAAATTAATQSAGDDGGRPRKRQRLALGECLERAVATLGRELTDRELLSTDYGAGSGSRLVPLQHGEEHLTNSPQLAAGLRETMYELMARTRGNTAEAGQLVALDGRRACLYYSGLDQTLADAHRIGLAPFVLRDATEGPSLRAALQV